MTFTAGHVKTPAAVVPRWKNRQFRNSISAVKPRMTGASLTGIGRGRYWAGPLFLPLWAAEMPGLPAFEHFWSI